ncbi:MAG: GNAT family N-acetyltransferase [Saprospiraceae bacterium]|nr:GNAT family N-acetyltransferase [Saprospiraceae bacterium]MCF8252204.1 GNAT family N-acetyltransferase [Saprospiraceae bacterium]MCF8282002.1 GNAT family N-acetyltransferase [Bacteroidales bacterium]MCF8311660.1 GNAT family N-acetyltransferase [Saprospiraceae bacterium]MCF8442579.1 GNAT family N-acetyltransferase [Saprospiraceae bacterium]
MNSSPNLRPATIDDVPLILQFIRELAEYERMLDDVVATEDMLRDSLFGHRPAAEVILYHEGEIPAGFALFFHNYSTFRGKSGIYLEDLFVRPQFRGRGYGKLLLATLAKLALERNCARLEWSVLDWNTPAINFYKSLGAQPMNEWTVYRLTGEALEGLGIGELGN